MPSLAIDAKLYFVVVPHRRHSVLCESLLFRSQQLAAGLLLRLLPMCVNLQRRRVALVQAQPVSHHLLPGP